MAMLFHLASEPTHLPLSHPFCSHSTYQCFTDMEFHPVKPIGYNFVQIFYLQYIF